ncbi:MAG: hypothetical protein U0805_16460 [Pirellulales bacterium]
MAKPEQPQHDRSLLANTLLWSAFFLPPAAWGFHLQFVYAAADQVCKGGMREQMLHIASTACLVASLLGGIVAFWQWLAAGATWPSEHRSDFIARQRFLSAEAMLASLLFGLVIVGQWLAVLHLPPCAH